MKINKNLKFHAKNKENHEHFEIPLENHQSNENHRITLECY